MRLDRPAGFYALYVLCLFGVLYAAVTSPVPASFALIADRAITLLFCCLLARGAACTWNDAVDRDLDKKVTRCQSRPIPQGGCDSLSGSYMGYCPNVNHRGNSFSTTS